MAGEPTLANGKICYVEIPSEDVTRSATFYKNVFSWESRERGDGHVAFDDTTGQVSGSWVTGRPSFGNVGTLVYVMVDDIVKTMQSVVANGGVIVQEVGADAPELTARFTDPDGNIFGLYQQPA